MKYVREAFLLFLTLPCTVFLAICFAWSICRWLGATRAAPPFPNSELGYVALYYFAFVGSLARLSSELEDLTK